MTELTEIWKQSNPQLNQAFQRAGNGMDLSHLMNDLKDPEFQKRLTSMKTRQQEYIMTLLRRRGQLIELPDGGSIIITGPNLTSFTIPLSLKTLLISTILPSVNTLFTILFKSLSVNLINFFILQYFL